MLVDNRQAGTSSSSGGVNTSASNGTTSNNRSTNAASDATQRSSINHTSSASNGIVPEASSISQSATGSKKSKHSSKNGNGDASDTSAGDSSSNAKRRKKNATMACNECRRKRNRCIIEEGKSTCKGCEASQADCQFAEVDKRRDGIQDLRDKLVYYESMFEKLKSSPMLNNSPPLPVPASLPNGTHTGLDHVHTHQPQTNGDLASASHSNQQQHQNHQHQHQQHYQQSQIPGEMDPFSFMLSASAPSADGSSFFGDSASQPSATTTPQSSIRSKRPREESEGDTQQQQQQQHQLPAQASRTSSMNNLMTSSQLQQSSAQYYAHPRQEEAESSTSPARHSSRRTPVMSAVMDCLAVEQDGRIRAYGATSTNALAGLDDAPDQDPKSAFRQRKYKPVNPSNLKDAPREVTPPRDSQPAQCSPLVAAAANIAALPLGTDIRTVQHLLNLYFMWAWPMFPIISRQVFMQHFANGGQYYSPLLLNALLALASHLSDWKVVRSHVDDPYTAGNTFFEMAKSLLEDELEKPSVTTVQALCLMAKREAYCGRPLRGGLYIAMCGRLVLDIGLHLDSLHLLDRGILTETDRYVRSVTFWGTWSVDKEYSAMVGRPCSIRNVVITCPRPGYWALEDFDWWDAYRNSDIGTTQAQLNDSWKGPCAVAKASLDMAGVHLRAMERLQWAESKASVVEHARNLEISMSEAREAMALLPTPETALTQGYSPHVITLHMVYHCHIIIINRPFLFDDPEERASRPPSANGGAEDTPRQRCFNSAQEIVRLMEMFKSMTSSGTRPILNCHQHNVVIAAAILIFQVTSITGTFSATYEGRLNNELLQRAFSLLAEMSEYRPAARQALSNLKNSYQQRRKREARFAHVLPSLPPAGSNTDTSNGFNFMLPFQNLDASASHEPFSTTNGQFQTDEQTANTGKNIPSAGIMDSSLHAPLFYVGDAPLDDFSDLDSFLAQHSGYLYSADLLKDFPGAS